jgi:hypothetical protein
MWKILPEEARRVSSPLAFEGAPPTEKRIYSLPFLDIPPVCSYFLPATALL